MKISQSITYGILTLLFFFSSGIIAQNTGLDEKIDQLKKEIAQAEDARKIQLTDSLITLVEFNEDYNYSSLIKDNIALALQLDSIDLATKHTADFIYYQNIILGRPEKGLQVFEDYKGKEQQGNNYVYMTNLYLYGADSFFYLGNELATLEELNTAEKYAKLAKNERRIATVVVRKGMAEAEMGQAAEASQKYRYAANIFQEVKDTIQYLNTLSVLSILYSQNDFFEEAKKVREDGIALSKKTQGTPFLTDFYFNSGADCRMKSDYTNWIRYLQLAKKENEKSQQKNFRVPIILSELAIAAAITDSIPLAEKYLAEFKSQVPNYDKQSNKTYYIEILKQLAFANKSYDEALRYGAEHLALKRQENSYIEIINAEKFVADVYKAIGNKNKENEHLVSYYKIKDSISSVKNVQNLSYYQTIFETEKRDLKIQAQESDIALLDEKNKVKNQWLLFGGLGTLAFFGFILMVRSRNNAKNRQKLQENFTKDLLKTQENERARIASELHDSVGQKLLILKNSFLGKEKEAKKEIDLVSETIKEVREMSHNLHPFQFEKLGLITSLKNMIETFQKNSNVFYSEEIEIQDGLIAKEKEIYIFRMLQEAITNVEKHAEANACNLSTHESKGDVVFILKDNGKGFETTTITQGLGMKTLQERALFIKADLKIKSTPRKGTTMTLKIPKI